MGKELFDVSAGGLDGVAATWHAAGAHVENGAAPPLPDPSAPSEGGGAPAPVARPTPEAP